MDYEKITRDFFADWSTSFDGLCDSFRERFTHDTDEAVYLSRRVLVMSDSPGRFKYELDIDLPYPRDQLTTRESAGYLRYRHEILSRLVGAIPAGS